jgi:hypothetical protein
MISYCARCAAEARCKRGYQSSGVAILRPSTSVTTSSVAVNSTARAFRSPGTTNDLADFPAQPLVDSPSTNYNLLEPRWGLAMPQTPEDLSRIIIDMARRHAANYGRTLSRQAAERIGRIPPEYRSREQISVDLKQLDAMIEQVVKYAVSSPGDVIGLSEMENALRSVPCHYLWFC